LTEPNFYTPPAADAPAPLRTEGGRFEYRSPDALARGAVLLLVLCVLASLASMFANWIEIDLLERVARGNGAAVAELSANVGVQSTLILATTLVSLATGLVFVLFMRRTSFNARALGARHLAHSPAAAVYWWFVPLANLVKPYAVMVELWRAVAPRGGRARWDGGHRPALLPLWWGLYLGQAIVVGIASIMETNARDVDTAISADWLNVVGNLGAVAAAAAAIQVVRGLAQRQTERCERVARRRERKRRKPAALA
jgi:uncharacterized protein DUF4328